MIKFAPIAGLAASFAVTVALAQPPAHTDHDHAPPPAAAPAAPGAAAAPGAMAPCPMMASMAGGRAGMPMQQGQVPPPGPTASAPPVPPMPMKAGAMPRGAGMPMPMMMCMGPNGPQPVEPPKAPQAAPKE